MKTQLYTAHRDFVLAHKYIPSTYMTSPTSHDHVHIFLEFFRPKTLEIEPRNLKAFKAEHPGGA
jgi:hypothetical protein